MKPQLHEFYITRKCTKYEYFTVKAESMEQAKYEAEEGYDVENAELSMRLYDSELTEDIEHDMENLL